MKMDKMSIDLLIVGECRGQGKKGLRQALEDNELTLYDF
jgi:hypothetical protein